MAEQQKQAANSPKQNYLALDEKLAVIDLLRKSRQEVKTLTRPEVSEFVRIQTGIITSQGVIGTLAKAAKVPLRGKTRGWSKKGAQSSAFGDTAWRDAYIIRYMLRLTEAVKKAGVEFEISDEENRIFSAIRSRKKLEISMLQTNQTPPPAQEDIQPITQENLARELQPRDGIV